MAVLVTGIPRVARGKDEEIGEKFDEILSVGREKKVELRPNGRTEAGIG